MSSDALRAFALHEQAFATGDLDAVVAGYAPDAVFVDTNGGEHIGRGREHIRARFAEQGDVLAGWELSTHVLSEGDVVFVSWRATKDGQPDLVGAETFVVADGLITVHVGVSLGGAPAASSRP